MTITSAVLTDSAIQDALWPYFRSTKIDLCSSIRAYMDLLLRWNQRLSLTTVTDPLEILRFHIGESIAAIPIAQLTQGRLADVGSGAGLPGIPLALFAPNLEVTLIESNIKKATFLAEVQRSLHLSNLRILRGRFEDVQKPVAGWDFVTARALGSYDDLLLWSSQVLTPSGHIVLWLGCADARRVSQTKAWNWQGPAQISDTKNRVLLVGQTL